MKYDKIKFILIERTYMLYINDAIQQLLEKYTPTEIANEIKVSTAMISTWKNKDNDFVPRVNVAAKIYQTYGIHIYPYDKTALANHKVV